MFRSFFLAGFEGSTGYNRHGEWFDQVSATGHDKSVNADYEDIARLGLLGARETMRWPLIDLGRGRYDFASVRPFVHAAHRHGVGVIWDLFHYGYPRHVDLWSEDFPRRFADYCYAAARYIAAHTEGPALFTPVNEPSYMAHAGGEQGLFAPYAQGRGWDLKVALCRAAIAGIDAIRAASPRARIVNVDPLCRVVCPPERPDLAAQAEDFNQRLVFQSWDMLCGRLLPELGGSRAHLDIVGVNYYWTNQWEWGHPPVNGVVLPLAENDSRRLSLAALLRGVWHRYGGEIMITETAHVGEQRGPWMREVAAQSELLLCEGVPLRGVCIYPILGMPEWHDRDTWTCMGLWDPLCRREPHAGRLICEPMLEALRHADHLNDVHCTALLRAESALPPDRSLQNAHLSRYALPSSAESGRSA